MMPAQPTLGTHHWTDAVGTSSVTEVAPDGTISRAKTAQATKPAIGDVGRAVGPSVRPPAVRPSVGDFGWMEASRGKSHSTESQGM